MAKKSSKSGTGVDQTLMDFVIKLAADDTFRQQFNDPNQREQVMDDAGLKSAAKDAIRNHDENAIERMLNVQIVTIEAAKKPGKKRKTAKKKARKSGKKR